MRCQVDVDNILQPEQSRWTSRTQVSGPKQDHDASINAATLIDKTPCDLERLKAFIRNLLDQKGDKILRTKGSFCIQGSDHPLIVQGVERSVEFTTATRPWGDRQRLSRLVFIGRQLNQGDLSTQYFAMVHPC